MNISRKIKLALASAGVGLIMFTGSVPAAEAVTIQTFHHGTRGNVRGLLVWSGSNCTGHYDMVYQGQEAEMGVRSITLGPYVQLWYANAKWFHHKSYKNCRNFTTFPFAWPNQTFDGRHT
jgi:hypothetical protein